MSGHEYGHTKVAYFTPEQAELAAQHRREELGKAFKVYACRYIRPRSAHPVLHGKHYHITTYVPYRSAAARLHEQFNDILGPRVAGCLHAENLPRVGKRYTVIFNHVNGIQRRLSCGT